MRSNFIGGKELSLFRRNCDECHSPEKPNSKASRFDKLYSEAKRRLSYKGLTTKEKLEQESLKECTFKPKVNDWLWGDMNVAYSGRANEALYERAKKRLNRVNCSLTLER